jgi:hypothetical protein
VSVLGEFYSVSGLHRFSKLRVSASQDPAISGA